MRKPALLIEGPGAEGVAAALDATSLVSAAVARHSDSLKADAAVVVVGPGPGGAAAAVDSLRRLPSAMRAGRTVAVAAPGPSSLGLLDEVRRLAPIVFEGTEGEDLKRLVERLLRFVEVALRPSNPFAPGANRFRPSA